MPPHLAGGSGRYQARHELRCNCFWKKNQPSTGFGADSDLFSRLLQRSLAVNLLCRRGARAAKLLEGFSSFVTDTLSARVPWT